MFRLAHITDPHVGPLPRLTLRQLLGKRATGFVNWHRGRRRHHDMELLAALVADLAAQNCDHVACTGDLCNLGLPVEWGTARVFLEALGAPDRVSFVPGNHDAYVRGSLEGMLGTCLDWTVGEEGEGGHFPFLRRRGGVALIGLSSAIPTKPFSASGRLGPTQIAAAETLLSELAREPDPPFRVVMIHHPPHPGGTKPGRDLKDAVAMTQMLARVGAELVLHGHNHVGSIAYVAGPDAGRVPIVGAPSASARSIQLGRRASYFLYEMDGTGAQRRITMRERGVDISGTVATLSEVTLTPESAQSEGADLLGSAPR